MFVISKTHVGMVRTVNEDALLTTGPELFALADGMGGYAAGETASREALQVLQQEAEKFKELTGTELCTAMRETVQQANKHIRQMAQNEIQYHDMGTTLVAVYLAADGKAYAVNVGDSRLYVIGEDITQITDFIHGVPALYSRSPAIILTSQSYWPTARSLHRRLLSIHRKISFCALLEPKTSWK